MASALPDFPELMAQDDSMLSRKFGKEVFNYFGWSSLNRLSFLRTDNAFLSSAWSHPDSTVIPLKELSPLGRKGTEELLLLKSTEVFPLTGSSPFRASEEEMIRDYDSTVHHPLIIFLGIEESDKSTFEYKKFRGNPFFAVDVTPKGHQDEIAKQLVEKFTSNEGEFKPASFRSLTLSETAAGYYGQARALADWNLRNQFCAGCGSPTLSVNAGYKRACPPTDRKGGATSVDRPACATRGVVSNLAFPRTDSVMIAAIVSADGQRVLLGRQSRYPRDWYSTLAGFIEPGESVESAVRREVWEESGVLVGRVVLHSSQPWPYPANLMIGAIGQARPGGEEIDLGNDPELQDAKWFPIEEVREALRIGVSGLGEPAPEGYKEGGLRLPPPTAIANQLLTAVVNGFATETLGTPKI